MRQPEINNRPCKYFDQIELFVTLFFSKGIANQSIIIINKDKQQVYKYLT